MRSASEFGLCLLIEMKAILETAQSACCRWDGTYVQESTPTMGPRSQDSSLTIRTTRKKYLMRTVKNIEYTNNHPVENVIKKNPKKPRRVHSIKIIAPYFGLPTVNGYDEVDVVMFGPVEPGGIIHSSPLKFLYRYERSVRTPELCVYCGLGCNR